MTENPYDGLDEAQRQAWQEGYEAGLAERRTRRATSTVSCPHGYVDKDSCYFCGNTG